MCVSVCVSLDLLHVGKKKTLLFRKVRMFLESEDILAAQHNLKGLRVKREG